MTAPQEVVIVGAGAAGTAAATQLRHLGFQGELTIVHGEDVPPYNRTTVNKTLLQPGAQFDAVRTAVPDDPRTTLLAARAWRLDTERRIVVLENGRRLLYDALLIATGARPRELPVREQLARAPGVRDRVTALRTHADAERIQRALAGTGTPARVAIAGASLLGSETADVLNGLGHDVFLTDNAANPLHRRLGTTIAAWVETRHEENLAGVINAGIDSLEARGREMTLALSNGQELSVDLLIEALGVTPDVNWLHNTPLALDDGVVVDDRLRTLNVDRVYAAGDLARIEGSARVEHWGHALAHGAHAARAMGHDLHLAEDPGAFQPSGSYSTWLYGKPINVLGAPSRHDREVALAPPGHGVHVTVYTDAANRLSAAVTLGSAKLANRLRPLVTAGAAIEDAAGLVMATLKPAASGL